MATVTVRGTGTANGTPDEATLGRSLDAVAERTKALVTLCHEVGLADADVATTGVNVAEHGDRDKDGRLPVAAGKLGVVATVDVEFNLEQG